MYCPAAGSCNATGAYEPRYGARSAGMILTLAGGSWSAQTAPLPPGFPGAASTANTASTPQATAAPLSGATQDTTSSTSSSLAGVGCGVDGFCATAGEVGSGGGLLETGGFSRWPAGGRRPPPVTGPTGRRDVGHAINGSNFGTDSVASFGGKAVPTTVLSATQLVATAPAASAAGAVNVTVTTGGTQSCSAPDNEYFTKVPRAAPAVLLLSRRRPPSADDVRWAHAEAGSSQDGVQAVNVGAPATDGLGGHRR